MREIQRKTSIKPANLGAFLDDFIKTLKAINPNSFEGTELIKMLGVNTAQTEISGAQTNVENHQLSNSPLTIDELTGFIDRQILEIPQNDGQDIKDYTDMYYYIRRKMTECYDRHATPDVAIGETRDPGTRPR